jgi:hypothetical protein
MTYNKGRTIALRNDTQTQENIRIGIEANVWGSRFAGVNSEVKSGEVCVFLIGISIANLQELKKSEIFKDKLKGFPNIRNEDITDELLDALEFNIEDVLVGETISAWYVDTSEIWPPRKLIKKRKRDDEEEISTLDFYKNRFMWRLTHRASNLLVTRNTFDKGFLKSVLLSLRDKCVAPFDIANTADLKNFKLGMQLSEPKSEEEFQDLVQYVPSATLGDGPIEKPSKSQSDVRGKWPRNPAMSSSAIAKANHACEIDGNHVTFTSQRTNKNYTEAHHLIPMEFQGLFTFSLDVPENIVSLCSNCHDKFHYAIKEEKIRLIEKLYYKRVDGLKVRKIERSVEQLKKYYGI